VRPQAEQAEIGDGDGAGEPVVLDTRSLWTAIGTLAFSLPALGVPQVPLLPSTSSRRCRIRGRRVAVDAHSIADHAEILAVCSLQWAPDGKVVRTNVSADSDLHCGCESVAAVLAQAYNRCSS
jgi:hypothetical protein